MKTPIVTMHLVGEEFPQFNRKSNGTIVFEKPEPELLLSILAKSILRLSEETITLKIGASFLHPDDKLNRKTGRAMALSRMHDVNFTIGHHTYGFTNDSLWLVLDGADETLKAKYSITVKIYKDSRKLRVMGVHMRSWE